MIRKSFLLHLKPGCAEEYRRRHNPIWQELADCLKEHGASNYSIFLDEAASVLYAYVELESEERWNAVAGTPVCRRWWAWMSEIMPSNPDGSPVSRELSELFHLS